MAMSRNFQLAAVSIAVSLSAKTAQAEGRV